MLVCFRSNVFVLLGTTLTLAMASADEKLAGIACRSVHLQLPSPEGQAYYNEVTVEKSTEGTYFCVCGFNQGYFGIQEQARGKKVVIFSVWDPGRQDDPNSVDLEKRVKLISKDEKVRIGRFGNEGTGGQSFLDLDWKPGETYKFLVSAKVQGDRTEYSAFIAPPEANGWRHLATFSTIAKGKLVEGCYAFIEDFKRDKISATIERRALFGEAWLQTREGKWLALSKARFTADRNPAPTIDAGAEGGQFFLATGGKVENIHTPLNKTFELKPAEEAVAARPSRIPDFPR